MTKRDGSQRLRMYKQQSSYLSDFECESDEEGGKKGAAAVREAFEIEQFVGTVELDGHASSGENETSEQ